jgi:very-short-patch-repair endonuclease
MFRAASAEQRVRSLASRPGSDAGTESVVRQRLARIGISVRQQVAIAGVGRVDMIVKGTKVVVEVDGKSYHRAKESFENDRRRDADLAARGYVVVRLSFAQVFGNWPSCERVVAETVTQFRNL